MTLSDQVCSLEFGKRLKELGVKKESLFYWIKEEEPYLWYNSNRYPIHCEHWYYPAYSVAELGELLPKVIFVNEIRYYLTQIPTVDSEWILFYRNSFGSSKTIEAADINEANLRAQMIIYLIENKFMEIPK
jgi:hypothetical protein